MKAKLFSIFFFCFISISVFAQELLPFVENYNKSNYKGDNQIWNVVQGNDHAMYFANNNYLLRYNGVVWEKYTLPNKTIIRSIMVEGDKVYSGSYQEFGYWYRKDGKMHYVSISKGKNVFGDNNEEIWKIFKFKNKIYFQSFNGLFIFDGKKIKEKKIPFLISYCFELGQTALAIPLLNQIRNRAGLGDTPATTQAALRTAIWKERRVELAFEFDRFFDLVRTGQAKNAFAADKSDAFPNGRVFTEGKNELFPIPASFILQAKGKSLQNPGYN